MQFEHNIAVEWGDTDAAEIVFFPNFYKWMDESTHAFFRHLGIPTSQMLAQHQISIPAVETHCQFRKPLRFEDQVVVVTTIDIVKPKIIKFQHEFKCGNDIVASGYTLRCWTKFGESLKSVELPDFVKDKLIEHQFITVEECK